MKKHLKFGLFLLALWATIITALAQEKVIEYDFKKGEVFDVLLLNNGPEMKTLFPVYLKTVFPVGAKYSFQSVPGLPIAETLQGGVQPQSMIFGRWESLEKREAFLDAIVGEVSDFHEQRRNIWTYFALTYYEIKEDTHFTIDRSKYNVVTSYWGDGNGFDSYIADFKKATSQNGGKEVLLLTDGYSPAGYAYNPDLMTITQWENKTTFDAFYKKYNALSENRITNVHQFVLK